MRDALKPLLELDFNGNLNQICLPSRHAQHRISRLYTVNGELF
jgi:hypothetical protein